MEFVVRPAVSQDYQQVEAIMRQVHELHVGWRPDIYQDVKTVMPRELFQDLLRRNALLTASVDSQVIGLLAFQYRMISGEPLVSRKVLFIDDLAVLEGYRGRGVGRALLDRVAQIAAEEHCDGVELQVNAGNREAMEMYRHCGFTEKSINMELLF